MQIITPCQYIPHCTIKITTNFITANVGYLILAVREIHLNAVCTIVLTCGYDIFKTSVIIVILPIRCSELVFIAVYGHPSVLSATLYIVVHIERYKHYLIVRER